MAVYRTLRHGLSWHPLLVASPRTARGARGFLASLAYGMDTVSSRSEMLVFHVCGGRGYLHEGRVSLFNLRSHQHVERFFGSVSRAEILTTVRTLQVEYGAGTLWLPREVP